MAPPRRQIITPVLKYWNLRASPFEDFTLKDEELDLFIDRDHELGRLHNSLTSRLVGVYGVQGVGKSSLLRRFYQHVSAESPVVYVRTGVSEKTLYREILCRSLEALQARVIRKQRKFSLKVSEELERLRSSISDAWESQFGAQMVANGSVTTTKTVNAEKHTETTACQLLADLFDHLTTSVVVIVDDLERVKTLSQDRDSYLRFISSFARTIDEVFNMPGVAFVLSLDEEFIDRMRREDDRSSGAFGFSFGRFVEIGNFPPGQMVRLLNKRLRRAQWKGGLEAFIDPDAFWMLLMAAKGHARRTLRILQAAIEIVATNKRERVVNVAAMSEALRMCRESCDAKDLEIVRHLARHGPLSPSDASFQQAVGLSRSALFKRLKTLSKEMRIEVDSDDRSRKELYDVPWDGMVP